MADILTRRINTLLVFWYDHRHRMTTGRGFNHASTIPYSAPCHWDSRNGASDERAEQEWWRNLDAIINGIPNQPEDWRLALLYEAQRLATGAAVFTYQRLPKDREALEILVLEARNKMARALLKTGVLT